jgi:hypothetical protein
VPSAIGTYRQNRRPSRRPSKSPKSVQGHRRRQREKGDALKVLTAMAMPTHTSTVMGALTTSKTVATVAMKTVLWTLPVKRVYVMSQTAVTLTADVLVIIKK